MARSHTQATLRIEHEGSDARRGGREGT